VERAFRASARGYVMKHVFQALRCVLKGKLYLTERIARLAAEKLVGAKSPATSASEALLSGRALAPVIRLFLH
jgi:DNA-binding NarL/FixJ family response regulator